MSRSPNRPTLDGISVNQLLDRQPPAGQAERADAVRSVLRQDAQCTQPEIEVDLLLATASVDLSHGFHEFHAITDDDVGDNTALAGQDRSDPGRRDPGVSVGAGRLGGGQLFQPREPVGIPDLRHH